MKKTEGGKDESGNVTREKGICPEVIGGVVGKMQIFVLLSLRMT